MKASIEGQEHYPVWVVSTDIEPGARVYEVPEDMVLEYQRLSFEYAVLQAGLRRIVDPRCADCGHPGSRHQFSEQGNHAQEPGSTLCLFREPVTDGKRCRCTTPTPPNPNLVEA